LIRHFLPGRERFGLAAHAVAFRERHRHQRTLSHERGVITNLNQSPQWIYEQVYCQRGEIENRIKGAPGDRQGVSGTSPLH
jgi:hypothetical protein